MEFIKIVCFNGDIKLEINFGIFLLLFDILVSFSVVHFKYICESYLYFNK